MITISTITASTIAAGIVVVGFYMLSIVSDLLKSAIAAVSK